MHIKNTTIQNRSKQGRLTAEHKIPSQNVSDLETIRFIQDLQNLQASKEAILFTIGKQILGENDNPAISKFLSEYKYKDLKINNIPKSQFDLLGSVYQFLNSKLENLEKGSFYTGTQIALDIVGDLDFNNSQTIFDPACGSGAFLFNSHAGPKQIYGVDFDPIAVMIAKFNYFIKFPNAGYPNIFHADFFEWALRNGELKFDYVIGNPPYGANLDTSKISSRWVTSGESFSYFIEIGFSQMKPDGVFRYLLPEAVLNVKRHADIRTFLLEQTALTRIKKYSQKFAGVMSDVFLVEARRGKSKSLLFEGDKTVRIPIEIFKKLKNSIFVQLDKQDISILRKIESIAAHDLSRSIFGLGVVTGDNKSKLMQVRLPKSEPIFTGKEVQPYQLSEPRNFIIFDRTKMQQVAPDAIYRAPIKLVYKVISKKLKVAIDTSASLSTNSANLIIPIMPGYTAFTVAGLLNTKLYTYLHYKLFGGVNKIAKENLAALPFPELNSQESSDLEKLVKEVLKHGDDRSLEDYVNFSIFKLTQEEVNYIENCVTDI